VAEEEHHQVTLDPALHWCRRHLAPFFGQWPEGVGLAMVALFQAAAAMPAVQEYAGHDVARMQEALDRFSPLCCFVDKETLTAVYAAGGIGD
jgi:hypothetical protein